LKYGLFNQALKLASALAHLSSSSGSAKREPEGTGQSRKAFRTLADHRRAVRLYLRVTCKADWSSAEAT